MIILTDKMLVIPVGISPNYSSENKPSLEDKSVEITANGDYSYTAGPKYDGIGNFNVKVNVQGHYESYKTVNPSFIEDVTVTPSEGFDAMSSVIVKKAVANLQDKTVDKASTSQIVLTADEGYQGLGTVTVAPIKTTSVTADPSTNVQDVNANTVENEYITSVTINPVTSSIDSNIVPGNIAKGVSILGVTGNLEAGSTPPSTPTKAYAIRPKNEYAYNANVCILTHVLLNETSWVSLDFAMDAASLNKAKTYLFGISESSLYCYLDYGVLHMYTGEEVPMNKQITLDTNKHTLEFGFVSKADASGHAEFMVVFDGEMIADVMVLVPKFNLPLSLFDVPKAYDGTYDDYIAGGGIIYLVYNIGYSTGYNEPVNNSVFDLIALTVYDKPGYYRQTINAYTPSLDAENKPIFIDNITGEYQYPLNGNYSYVEIDGDIRTEIVSKIFKSARLPLKYFRPSDGAIVPTDIELPTLHRVIMYVKDIDSFDEGTSQDALNNVKNRVMIGAQPNIIAPFNHIDYEKGLPRMDEAHSVAIGDSSIGLFNSGFEVYGGYTYSIATEYGGTPQALDSLNGEHTIKFGQRCEDVYNIKTFFMLDANQDESHTIRGLLQPNIIDSVNNSKMTPLCIFGTYNFIEGTKPDYVNSLGYQNALNQIGYTTGVRYAVKQIDIEEYPLNSNETNSKSTLRHRLVTHNDINDVNCLFDTITGTTYYPYNGTLDVYTGPAQPEPPVTPDASILTNTYIKPSAGAIVPTDIKFTSLTNVTMHVKGFDNFEGESNLDSRAMIGAQPNFIISPFNRNDAERGLPYVGIPGQEKLDLLSDSSIGLYFFGCSNFFYSIYGDASQTLNINSEHAITVGYDPEDINNIMDTDMYLIKKMSIDGQGQTSTRVGPAPDGVYQLVTNQMTTPICIFGNYNNPNSMTPDDVIALGYENALSQIGYVTGARYGVKQIDINVRNADGSMTTTHSLVPARDTNGTICLYDTITNKSYYPFHGTLDII